MYSEIHFKSTDTERLKVRGHEKGFPYKWKWKKGRGNNIYINQNWLSTTYCNKRQRRALNNNQRINLRSYKSCKYVHSGAHKNIKKILIDLKREKSTVTQIVEGILTPQLH